MARCTNCGAETSLYVNGVPVCVKCDDALQAEAKRKEQARKPIEEETREQTEQTKKATG